MKVFVSFISLFLAGACVQKNKGTLLQSESSAQRCKVASESRPALENTLVRSLPRFYRVSDEVYRGSKPNAQQLRTLKDLGVRSVINLQYSATDNEESRNIAELNKEDEKKLKSLGCGDDAVRATQMTYLATPVMAQPLTPGDPQSLENIDVALNLLRDKNNLPAFVHCSHGEDRTGLVIGLYRVFEQKWSAEKAHAEMLEFNFHPILQNVLEQYFRAATR